MRVQPERLALAGLLLISIGLPVVTLGYQAWLRPALSPSRVIDIRAAAPEAGGFQPDAIQVMAGETVTLRFTSVDVTHGIAIGPGLGLDLGSVDAGHVKEVTLTFQQAGTYTFYCNSWCSPNHWRMRGVVEVRDPLHPDSLPTEQHDPIIEALIAEGINIDATPTPGSEQSQESPVATSDGRPAASRGEALMRTLTVPPDLQAAAWRRSHTPNEAIAILAAANPRADERDLADVVAYLWTHDLVPEQLAQTAALYNKNCAACHGQSGDGDGPAANLTDQSPVVFSDPAYMFTRRSDVLYAKIRRGGMGTGMPNFGTLFTPEETWDLVNYIWSLALMSDTHN